MGTFRFHQNDLADLSHYEGIDSIAVDTETMGLKPHRDRLCLVQISPGDGSADLISIARKPLPAPNLVALLGDPARQKIFHFARFDVAVLCKYLNVEAAPVWCTKIASRLARTYTDRHGLKELVRELLKVDISNQQQSSDWASDRLSTAQLNYAAADVLYLHRLRDILSGRLEREDRLKLAEACFRFLPARARLDLAGWEDVDIFAHA